MRDPPGGNPPLIAEADYDIVYVADRAGSGTRQGWFAVSGKQKENRRTLDPFRGQRCRVQVGLYVSGKATAPLTALPVDVFDLGPAVQRLGVEGERGVFGEELVRGNASVVIDVEPESEQQPGNGLQLMIFVDDGVSTSIVRAGSR